MNSAKLEEIKAEVEALPMVHSAAVWNGRRVYVNITGADRSKAGDRNAKVFYDLKDGWKIEGLKGCMSGAFERNIKAFAKMYYWRAFWTAQPAA